VGKICSGAGPRGGLRRWWRFLFWGGMGVWRYGGDAHADVTLRKLEIWWRCACRCDAQESSMEDRRSAEKHVPTFCSTTNGGGAPAVLACKPDLHGTKRLTESVIPISSQHGYGPHL
jgi:hypothetical protein